MFFSFAHDHRKNSLNAYQLVLLYSPASLENHKLFSLLEKSRILEIDSCHG